MLWSGHAQNNPLLLKSYNKFNKYFIKNILFFELNNI